MVTTQVDEELAQISQRIRSRRERAGLGPVSPAERSVAIVFAATALAWTFRPLLERLVPGLSDAGIGLLAGVALFVLPAGGGKRLLDAGAVRHVPWDVLLLFGGGLALAAAFRATGLATNLGELLSFAHTWPLLALMIAVSAVLIFLTELTSNTASTAAFLPVIGALAVGVGIGPLWLAVPAALAASCAFMLPVATPPNAVVYSSRLVPASSMARVGLWMNILMAVIVTAVFELWIAPFLGIDATLPSWAER